MLKLSPVKIIINGRWNYVIAIGTMVNKTWRNPASFFWYYKYQASARRLHHYPYASSDQQNNFMKLGRIYYSMWWMQCLILFIKSNQVKILKFILSFQLNWNLLLQSKLNVCYLFFPLAPGLKCIFVKIFPRRKKLLSSYVLMFFCPKKYASFYHYCSLVACKRNTTLARTETPKKKKKQIHRPWNMKEKALLKTFIKNIARLQVPGKKDWSLPSSILVFGK